MKRYLVLISAILLHLAVGSVYAWSVLVRPLCEIGWTLDNLSWVFGITIGTLGFSAAFLGNKVKKWGPRKSCTIAAGLFFVGMILFSVSTSVKSLFLLYLSYGLLVGIGTGIAYLTPIPIVLEWFPNNKGVATGLVVTGFGLSSLLAAHGYHALLEVSSVSFAIMTAGTLSTVLMIPAVFFLRKKDCNLDQEEVINNKDIFVSPNFRILWIVFFFNILVGISLISVMAPMVEEFYKVSTLESARLVAIAGICNGLSRCFWSSRSDKFGCFSTFLNITAIEILACCAIVSGVSYSFFCASVLLIISGYGGMFATMPSYVAELFKGQNITKIFGSLLAAWGVAGIIGPKLIVIMYNNSGSYDLFLYFAISLLFINILLLMAFLRKK